MPTFDDDEKSVQASRPSELYTVTASGATYRLTSGVLPITWSGNTWTPAVISRDNATTSQANQTRSLTVYLGINEPLAQLLLTGGVPPRDALVSIARYQQRSGTTQGFWLGHIVGYATDGTSLKLDVPSQIDDDFTVNLPIAVQSSICQHALYDSGCLADPAVNSFSTTVVSVSVDGLTIVLTSISGKPDEWARFGKLTRATDGDSRSVRDQTGTTIVVDVPFATLNPGDTVTPFAGCDHQSNTCRDKFIDPGTGGPNIVNFGGNPYLPTANILSPTGFGVIVAGNN